MNRMRQGGSYMVGEGSRRVQEGPERDREFRRCIYKTSEQFLCGYFLFGKQKSFKWMKNRIAISQ